MPYRPCIVAVFPVANSQQPTKPNQKPTKNQTKPNPAPQEVLTGEYNEKADIWSIGVALYVLLAGSPPFYAVRDEDVFRMIIDDGVPNM